MKTSRLVSLFCMAATLAALSLRAAPLRADLVTSILGSNNQPAYSITLTDSAHTTWTPYTPSSPELYFTKVDSSNGGDEAQPSLLYNPNPDDISGTSVRIFGGLSAAAVSDADDGVDKDTGQFVFTLGASYVFRDPNWQNNQGTYTEIVTGTELVTVEVSDTAVPEPASFIVWAGVGTIGLIACVWRRRWAKA